MPLRQAFAWWSFAEGRDAGAQLLREAARIGLTGVDFLPRDLWPAARDCGLAPTIVDGHEPLEVGFNDRSRHAALAVQVHRAIEVAAAERVPYVAVASGDRFAGQAEDGLAACAEGLAPLAAEAHAAGVVLLMEPLNTKVDHPGHECSATAWAAALVDEVGSPGLRILYDFYHAQIMEGDVLRTLDEHWGRIAHLHTAQVPGRHELDADGELNWPAIARWLHARGYAGWVSHELVPLGDPVAALEQAYAAFDVGRG